ncbi:unnamed protein product [Paramecium pentaurelia]|uniref:Uncharacterized protein n=1 Tax=Paramecium pentaurelia TaxID=43138 RepID=A0A8S1X865_9CILI|nr:unnamed protein product [Paramecium pentaurelia]
MKFKTKKRNMQVLLKKLKMKLLIISSMMIQMKIINLNNQKMQKKIKKQHCQRLIQQSYK